MTPLRATLAERSNVNLDLWNLFIVIVPLGKYMLNISSDYNDFGVQQFSKIIFSKKSHLNAIGNKFDLNVK